jgi:hypothetical protein
MLGYINVSVLAQNALSGNRHFVIEGSTCLNSGEPNDRVEEGSSRIRLLSSLKIGIAEVSIAI